MSIALIEARIKTTFNNFLGTARADALKVEAMTSAIVADIHRIVTRAAIIAFGFGFAVGAIAVFSSVHI